MLILLGILSGGSILLYPWLLNKLHLNLINFTEQKISILTNFSTLMYFLIYLSFINILFFSFTLKLKNYKIFFFLLITYIIQTLLLFYLITTFSNSEILTYYLYVATGEELVKFFLSLSLFLKYGKILSDILVFSIFSAISFAFIENFVYLFGNINTNIINISFFIGGLGLLISRGIIGVIAHIIFTGSIGQFIYKYLLSKNFIFLLGFCLGIGLHLIYDSLLTINFKWIIPLFVISGYIWLSYLFYNSDRFYKYYYNDINATMDKYS